MTMLTTDTADARSLMHYHAVVDVRSPGEFAEDHVPGAINLPVLDDAERAEVGTIYVQESRFRARRVGAAYIARNIARHLDGPLAERPPGFMPLIYCWRGGQRSHAMATILGQVGWPVTVLTGGYRTYRRHVQSRLYGAAGEGEAPLRIVLLDGDTGTGKTAVLHALAAQGVQTLDLEGLAGHRGSLFGALPGRPQPGQKLFESRLLTALEGLDPARPVVVEAESSKVGDRMVPPVLWRAMQPGPRIVLRASRAERARYLVDAYRDIVADPAALDAVLGRLVAVCGRKRVEEWRALAGEQAFEALADSLMEHHYDPAYARSARHETRTLLGEVAVRGWDKGGLDATTAEIAGLL